MFFCFWFWAGDVFFFCCLGGGRVFVFFAVWARDGSSLTCRSAWLVFRGPNNENDQTAKHKTQKKQHGLPTNPIAHYTVDNWWMLWVLPHPVTVYIRGPIKGGYI